MNLACRDTIYRPMSAGLGEICRERRRLLLAFSETACVYAANVREMADLAGAGLHSEVDVLRRRCRVGWENLEKARLALFRHEADHQCDRAERISAHT